MIALRKMGRDIFQMIKDEKQAPVTISDDPKASAKEANVIFAATNDPNVFIFKEDMPEKNDKEIYIVDTSTPHNVDKGVNELPHVHLRGGGLVTSVSGQTLIFNGTELNDKDLYACIAETILISLYKELKPSSGAISVEDLSMMGAAGEKFGFILSENEGKSDIFI